MRSLLDGQAMVNPASSSQTLAIADGPSDLTMESQKSREELGTYQCIIQECYDAEEEMKRSMLQKITFLRAHATEGGTKIAVVRNAQHHLAGLEKHLQLLEQFLLGAKVPTSHEMVRQVLYINILKH